MDPFTVAAALVGIVAPLLRTFAGAAADRAARKGGEAVGDAAVRQADALWRKLAPSLHAQPDADRAITELTADPRQDPARTVLGGRIAFLLDGDPGLLQEAVAVLEARDRHTAGTIRVKGDRNVVQLGDGNIAISGSRGITIRGGERPSR